MEEEVKCVRKWFHKEIQFTLRLDKAFAATNAIRVVLGKKDLGLNLAQVSAISRLNTILLEQVRRHMDKKDSRHDEVLVKRRKKKTLSRFIRGKIQGLIEKI